jgi:predicted ATPase
MAAKGFAAAEVERTYARALELCQQVGETPERFAVLRGLWRFYGVRADFQTAQALAQQLLGLAEVNHDAAMLLEAHLAQGSVLFWYGNFVDAQAHLERVRALYDPQRHRAHALRYGLDPAVVGLSYSAQILWILGYPEQSLQHSAESLSLAYELGHPHTLAHALGFAATLQQLRREAPAVSAQLDALMELAREQEFPQWLAWGAMLRGWELVERGRGTEGIAQMRQGLAAFDSLGAGLGRPFWLALLADACRSVGQTEEGLQFVTEAFGAMRNSGEHRWEVELHRLHGELLQTPATNHDDEAEASFHQALVVARRQHAKLLELRATLSLARLWQRQTKQSAAQQLLSPIYGWFSEGSDTVDLQKAKALLEELGG